MRLQEVLGGELARQGLLVSDEELNAQIPGSRLVVVPGAAHLCDMEAPERFTAEVRRFLDSVED